MFVNLAPEPEPFASAFAPVLDRFRRFGLDRLVSGHRIRYEIASNWKLVFQNYSECLHCPMIHPELSCKLPYQSGANDLVEGHFLGGYMEITEGNESVTVSGRRVAPLVAPLTALEQRRAYYYTLMPNLFLSIHPDYVNYYLVWPESPGRTVVESEWLFHPAAFDDPSFAPDDAVAMWDVTNRQDWKITEESLAGDSVAVLPAGPVLGPGERAGGVGSGLSGAHGRVRRALKRRPVPRRTGRVAVTAAEVERMASRSGGPVAGRPRVRSPAARPESNPRPAPRSGKTEVRAPGRPPGAARPPG